MAEGLARHLAGDIWEVHSAGSNPAGFVAEEAVSVLGEIGIDISQHYSKGVDELPRKEFDIVITMGCGDRCPNLREKQRLDWAIEDPIGRSPEFFRRIRDLLESKIKELLAKTCPQD